MDILDEDLLRFWKSLSTTRLKQAILLSDTEKFRRFTKMMRIGLMLKNAKKYPLNP